MLKCYVADQKAEWEKYLPLMEYAYNNITHASTSKAPFEIIYGKPLLPPILHTKTSAADEFVWDIDQAYQQVKQALARSQEKQKKAVDKLWRKLTFAKDQWVLLRFEKARLRKATGKEGRAIKLFPRFYGPFKILECINDVSFRLALPANWNMHNAFHSSLLKPFMGQPPAEPIIEDPPQVDELE